MSQITTSFQRAFQYTIMLSVLYIVVKFLDIDAPKGSEFLSYIVPMVLTNVVIIAFPVLFVIFYFKDGNTLENIKDNILDKHDPEIKNQEMLREYHGMLKEGIITQEEFDNIKKVLWFVINFFIMLYFSYYHVTIHWDAAIPFVYLMFLITFPSGLIIPFIYMLLSYILPTYNAGNPYSVIGDIIIPSLLFSIIGYIQWFIIVPKIKNYLNKRK